MKTQLIKLNRISRFIDLGLFDRMETSKRGIQLSGKFTDKAGRSLSKYFPVFEMTVCGFLRAERHGIIVYLHPEN